MDGRRGVFDDKVLQGREREWVVEVPEEVEAFYAELDLEILNATRLLENSPKGKF